MSALTRRDCLALLAAGVSLPGMPALASAHEQDWDWLLGSWDVWHRRLKDRLVGSQEWQEFTGRSAFWHTMGGLGNIDDNSLALPAGDYRGLSVRAFDPKAGSWAIWWLDGRNPEHIDPPVRGGFHGDEGEFIGTDTHKGTPVTVRFRWHEVRSKRPWWDQAFSTDGGKTWEINWRNYFTRTNSAAAAQPRLAGDPPEARAWDFLVGKWKVRNRRLRSRFTNSKDWDEFDSTLTNWQVLGGRGNVGDNWFRRAEGALSRHEPARLQRREAGMAELVAGWPRSGEHRHASAWQVHCRHRHVDRRRRFQWKAHQGAFAVDAHGDQLATLGTGRVSG